MAQMVTMILDMGNTRLRHAAITQSGVTMRMSPAIIPRLASMTKTQFQRACELLCSGFQGSKLAGLIAAEDPVVGLFMSTIKSCGKRVLGSPASFAALRSQASACWGLFGDWTSFVTINPSGLNAELCFALSGHPFTFTTHGQADTMGPQTSVSVEQATMPHLSCTFQSTQHVQQPSKRSDCR